MFTRQRDSNEYTLLQQSPTSPRLGHVSPTTTNHFVPPDEPPLKRHRPCKTCKFVLFVSISAAALVLVIYPTIQLLRSDTISFPSALKYSDPTEKHAFMSISSSSIPIPSTTLLQWPGGKTETGTATSSAKPSNLPAPVSTIPFQNHPKSSLSPELSPKPATSSALTAPSNSSFETVEATTKSSTSLDHLASPDVSKSKPISALPLAINKSLCDYCSCSPDGNVSRTFNQPDPSGSKFLDSSRLKSSQQLAPSPQTRMMGQIWASIRDVYCQHPMLSTDSALRLLENTRVDSPNLPTRLQWNLTGIAPAIPTLYLFTKTSRLGRTSALRPDYFRRHSKTINTHLKRVRDRGGKYFPETEPKWGTGPRQLIWILVEDGEDIAPDVEAVIRESRIPFIYVAYGSTNRYGNAQQNAAYAIIHRLSHSVLGHGPIVSIDDDGNFLPELLDLAWRVRRLGAWPMGNLGPTGWEGPKFDNQTHAFLGWQKSPKDNRRFPLDNGAFAFSTEVLGTGRMVGPRYWPTDYPGGESEFVSLILSKLEEVEPLCHNCHVAWHNQRLTSDCIAHNPKCYEFDVPVAPKSP